MENIQLWWKYKGRYIIPSIKQGIKNLIRWFPVIWKDRNYDHQFIFEILEFKLAEQSKYLKSNDRHVSTARETEKMDLCVRLIRKIKSDYYGMEYMDYHKSKFNFIDIPGTEYSELDIVELSENFQAYFDKYPLAYKKVTATNKYVFVNDTKQKIAMNIAVYNQNRCHALLFKIIECNIGNWWD